VRAPIHRPPNPGLDDAAGRKLTTDIGDGRLGGLRFLLGDRDTKYSEAFDAVFRAEDIDILCDHTLLLNEAHARKVLAEYQLHYTSIAPTKAENSDHPNGTNSPIEYRKPTPAHRYAPGSSMDSSTNTATQLDQQR